MKPTSTIANVFFTSILLIIVLIGGSLGYSWIQSETDNFEHELKISEEQFVEQQKAIIKAEVENVTEYILFKQNENIEENQQLLKAHTEKIYQLIALMYERRKRSVSKRKLKKQIISFFDKHRDSDTTYQFVIQQLGGKLLFDKARPQKEGKNYIDLQDFHGQYIIQQMEKLAREKGESPINYAFKVHKNKKPTHVLAYLKFFKPLDIYVVTGMSLEKPLDESKSEALKWIKNIHFSSTGYLYVLDHGRNFVAHPYPEELKKHKEKWLTDYPQILDSLIDESLNEKGSFFRYNYPLPGQTTPEPKLVYARSFKQWSWTIVGGIYLNQFANESKTRKAMFISRREERLKKVISLISLFLIISIAFAYLIAQVLRNNIAIFNSFFSQALLHEKRIDHKKLIFKDFQELALAANEMIAVNQFARKALEDSEKRLTSAIEMLPMPLMITNLEKSPVYINKAFLDTFGYALSDFSSYIDWFRFAFPDSDIRNEIMQTWDDIMKIIFERGESVERKEWVVKCKDKQLKEVYFEFVPMGDQLLIAMTDISKIKESEIKLRETLTQLNAILEHSPSQIAVIQKNGNILYVNRTIQGLAYDKVKGDNFFDLYPKTLQRVLRPAFQKVYATEVNHKFDYQDSKNNWWETLLIPIKDSIDNIDRVIAISNDITVRKWAERALQEREERFKELSDATFEGILILHDNYIIEANSIASTLFGYSSAELVGNPLTKLLELDDKLKQEIEKRKDTTESTETIGYKKNGERIYCEVRTKFSFYNGQKANVTAIRDVTARIETQEALSHTEALLETANQRSPIGIIIADTFTSKVRMANDAAAEVFGLSSSREIIGYNYMRPGLNWRFLHYDGKEMQIDDLPLYRSARGEVIKNMKAIVRRQDGSYRWLLVNAAPIRNQQGFVTAAVMTFPDITDLKQTEQRLIEAKEKAEEADKLKSAFLANMSHEIRTPMNAIIGFSDMLADAGTSEEERLEYIRFIIENGKSLLNLIEDIIDISKIEAKQIDIDIINCNMVSFFRELDAIFKSELKRLDKEHISLVLEVEDEREVKYFHTDSQRLKQVFSNLLSNAIKFTDSGVVSFGYRVLQNRLYFFVKDTGIGIPKEKQSEIFNRFTKLNSSKNRLFGGTGLGLAISKRIVELLGGKIGLNSQIGEGSLSYFSLQPRELDNSRISINEVKAVPNKLDLSGKRILVAEDEEANFKLIKAVFKKENVELIRAKNGYEVISYLDGDQDIDIILMDIKMPVMDGYETIKLLKDRFQNIPVIAQTALAMSNDRMRILNAGFNDYIAKPLKKQDLLDKIGLYI